MDKFITSQDVFEMGNNDIIDIPEDILESSPPTPTSLRISTMTATCETNLEVNMHVISHYTPLVDNNVDTGIIKIIYADIKRGSSKKDKTSSKKIRKVFYNQATMVIQLGRETGEITIGNEVDVFTDFNQTLNNARWFRGRLESINDDVEDGNEKSYNIRFEQNKLITDFKKYKLDSSLVKDNDCFNFNYSNINPEHVRQTVREVNLKLFSNVKIQMTG